MPHDLIGLLSQYGLAVVFANVLTEQIGLPIPAIPTLAVAGALGAAGQLSLPLVFLVALIACLIADSTWYVIGRIYGNSVMKTLCRISLTPDSCVNETQSRFERWGMNALVVAKFVPGLSLIAPPLAGATHIGFPTFLFFNGIGAMLWVAAGVGGGALFGRQIEYILARIDQFGSTAVIVIVLLLAAYIAYKWWERRRFYKMLRMARISVDELYRLMNEDKKPVVVAVRSHIARGSVARSARRRRESRPRPAARSRHHSLLHLSERGFRRECGQTAHEPRFHSRAPSARRSRCVARGRLHRGNPGGSGLVAGGCHRNDAGVSGRACPR
jgi:membrane protein DedA with SNARE-associated domain